MNKFVKLTLHALFLFTLAVFSGCGGGGGGTKSPTPTPTPPPTYYTVTVSSAGTGVSGGGNYVANSAGNSEQATPHPGGWLRVCTRSSIGNKDAIVPMGGMLEAGKYPIYIAR